MHRKTKIVATIGPATNSEEMIESLFLKGVNVIRINCSHGTHEEHKKVIDRVKRVRKKYEASLPIMIDTKGPEIRTGEMGDLFLAKGARVSIVKEVKGDQEIPITPTFIFEEIPKEGKVLFDDGYLVGKIVGRDGSKVHVEMQNSGILKNRKTVCFPNQEFPFPDMTEKDIEDIKFACQEEVEIIAASFIGSVKQLLSIRDLMEKEGGKDIILISKIESRKGVNNFDDILQVSDGIMVARGDLGIELSVIEVPPLQKKMIAACNKAGKPVIIATQMLESMIKNPLPTRAETSDVANAIYDATSAVMLSGETAMGEYPLETVEMMHQVIIEAEKDFHYRDFFYRDKEGECEEIPAAVARSAVQLAYSVDAKAIFVSSKSGSTVTRISRFRPEMHLVAVTPDQKTFQKCGLFWGASAIMEKSRHIEEEFVDIACTALQKGIVSYGDTVLLTSGKPSGVSFSTNTAMVLSIGDVLVRGMRGACSVEGPIEGEVELFIRGAEHKEKQYRDKIIVLSQLHKDDIPFLQEAKALVIDNTSIDKSSDKLAHDIEKRYSIPFILNANGARSLLQENPVVRIWPYLGIITQGKALTPTQMLQKCQN